MGRLLHVLDERQLDLNTIVVFLGDNGFMMGERGWDGKVLPYDGSIRVPLIVRAPGLATRHGRTDAAPSSLDLPPTFLRWAGTEPPAAWPGRDLTPALLSLRDLSLSGAPTAGRGSRTSIWMRSISCRGAEM